MTRRTPINDQICSTDSVAKVGAENGYWAAGSFVATWGLIEYMWITPYHL